MKSVKDLQGKDVLDGAREKIGVAVGVDIDLPDYDIFLRVEGEKMKSVRGRSTEFLPIKEIDYVQDDVVRLYKDLEALTATIADLNLSEEVTYRGSELMGKQVTTSDAEDFGVIEDVLLSEDFNEGFFAVAGPKVEEIRGNVTEVMSMLQFIDVEKTVHLIHDYDTISVRVREDKATLKD